ncbi:MAG: hypothetical protein Q4D57_04895, partial [Clostridia bacterium]|nr:hypothetical protein [Clostridia bacterium]
MNTKNVVVAVAAGVVAAVLAGGVAAEIAAGTLTHSANPLNLKVLADFNKFATVEKSTELKGNPNFEAVKAFVVAKGAGTLTATKEGEVWTYKYEPAAKKEEKADEKKEEAKVEVKPEEKKDDSKKEEKKE